MASAIAVSLVDAAVRAAVTSGAPRRTVAATAAAVATAAMAALRVGQPATGGELGEPSAVSPKRKRKRRRGKKPEKPAANSGTGATEEAEVGEAAATSMVLGEMSEVGLTEKDDKVADDGDAARPPSTPPLGTTAMPTLSPENLRLHNAELAVLDPPRLQGEEGRREHAYRPIGERIYKRSAASVHFSDISGTSHSASHFSDIPGAARKRGRGRGRN